MKIWSTELGGVIFEEKETTNPTCRYEKKEDTKPNKFGTASKVRSITTKG